MCHSQIHANGNAQGPDRAIKSQPHPIQHIANNIFANNMNAFHLREKLFVRSSDNAQRRKIQI
jgi:hypothetical protein